MNQEYLKSILTYNPELGLFHWKIRKGRCKPGQLAGWLAERGSVAIKIDRKVYMARRLAWLYMTGRLPLHNVAVKDGCKDNDSWNNLYLEARRYRYESK